jgi:hypothetical protein
VGSANGVVQAAFDAPDGWISDAETTTGDAIDLAPRGDVPVVHLLHPHSSGIESEPARRDVDRSAVPVTPPRLAVVSEGVVEAREENAITAPAGLPFLASIIRSQVDRPELLDQSDHFVRQVSR